MILHNTSFIYATLRYFHVDDAISKRTDTTTYVVCGSMQEMF